WYAVPSLALGLGGGSYLRDPYQGFPRARFFTAGVRLLRPAPPHLRSGDPDPPEPVWAPLMPKAHGDTVSVRFEMPGAASVAIAGDWNDWSLTPLTSLGNETWAGDLLLKAGTYHFNLRVDGKEWVVPHGV